MSLIPTTIRGGEQQNRENVFKDLKTSTKFRTPKYIKNRTKIIENSLRAMPLPKGRDK